MNSIEYAYLQLGQDKQAQRLAACLALSQSFRDRPSNHTSGTKSQHRTALR
jgi:hypothetical protein